MTRYCSTAPTRVDLAGGTLDLWPIHHLLDSPCTVNFAVDLPASVEIRLSRDKNYRIKSEDQELMVEGDFASICQNRELPLVGLILRYLWKEPYGALEIKLSAKSPAGAGLGGSSCLAIALCGVLSFVREKLGHAPNLSSHELVETARDIEARLIEIPTGVQDYWGAVSGGANIIEFFPGRPVITSFKGTDVGRLADDLLLVYSGKSRASAGNNWQIFKAFFDGDKRIRKVFAEIAESAVHCATALRSRNFSQMIEASQREWALRTSLWPDIETSETKKIAQAAGQAGAYFSRVCGAGGGGVMAVFVPSDKREKVREAVTNVGGKVLDAGFKSVGLKITEHLS
jgi:D-glycero-alpha-D-manno-heptose-7-phosphate kinase